MGVVRGGGADGILGKVVPPPTGRPGTIYGGIPIGLKDVPPGQP